MMLRLRLWVCLLLLLAVPLQGLATAAMLFCTTPLGAEQVQAPAGLPLADAAHEHPKSLEHQHPGVQRDANAPEAVSDTPQGSGAPMDEPAPEHGKCAACAACCTPAFMASLPRPMLNETVTAELVPFLPRAVSSHIPEGLDPPPRAFLA